MRASYLVRAVLASPRSLEAARNVGLAAIIASVVLNGYVIRNAQQRTDGEVARIAREQARLVLRETPAEREARIIDSAITAIRICARDPECRIAGRRAFGIDQPGNP